MMSRRVQMHNDDNRPKWLLELENRKRKPRLAHEVGAGAPCSKCDAICPGLDLHFWRKICKNCKCSRDDHMISDDEFPQFDLLLGVSGGSKRTCVVLRMNEQRIDDGETFEWAPPDTTRELAADYMKALPEGKLPIKGSAGAALRKQQLQKQLPLHDIQYEMCDELSGSEKEQFKKYLENLRKYVGQGKVSKIVGARPFDLSLITPVNASECLTPKHKSRYLASEPTITLRTPSSFVPKSDYSFASSWQSREPLSDVEWSNVLSIDQANTLYKPDNFQTPNSVPCVGNVVEIPRCHHALDFVGNNEANVIKLTNMYGNTHYHITNSAPSHRSINDENRLNAMSDLTVDGINDERPGIKDESIECGGMKEMARLNLLDQLENGDVTVVNHRCTKTPLNKGQSSLHFDNSCHPENLPFQPKLHNSGNIDEIQSMIERNIAIIPSPCGELKQPTVEISCGIANQHSHNSYESTFTDHEQLIDATPLHNVHRDTDVVGSSLDGTALSNIREKLMIKYNAKDNSNKYLICKGYYTPPIIQGSIRYNEQDSCSASNNLIDSDGDSAMMQMHLISYKNPDNTVIRSERLNNSIFPDEIVGKSNMSIDGLGSTTEHFSFSPPKEITVRKCHECTEEIKAGDVVVSADKMRDAAWHPGCFVCCACKELLVDLVYFHYKEKLYCARDLAKLMEIPRCFACDELIFVREYTVAEGHNYHIKHFCCWDCDVPLAGKQYISEKDRPLCLCCYQKTYAKLCCACNKIIAANQQGVAVKNLDFHASDQCFRCFNCSKTLLNGRMAVKENRLFCTKECISMYVNRNIS